ncbi:hypothetical protein FRC04_000764 [Tulasnella sp. 424]|nr:hypothetical protein FRC04_000764 [Tulasnella sp. 424]KAG8969929.1 hypothetical protein FRC05_000780 [Tulasnella sp. 425]
MAEEIWKPDLSHLDPTSNKPDEIWKPDLSHLDPTSNKPDKIWKPDFGYNYGATDSTSGAGKEETWKPALPGGPPSSAASGNSQGSTKPTTSTNPTPGSIQGPTSNNANTNPGSSSVNGSDPTTSNGSLNNSKPANGTGDVAGGGGVLTDSAGGSSTAQPGSNRPTTGGAQPTPQPTATLEKPTGGQTPSGGTLANADPWNANCLVQSPARGGSGGTAFSDAGCVTFPQTTNITAVKINYNTGIDRIQVCYGGKWAETHGGKAGSQGLSEETFYLQRGEVIVQIEGRSGTRLDSLQFTTSTGRKSKGVYTPRSSYNSLQMSVPRTKTTATDPRFFAIALARASKRLIAPFLAGLQNHGPFHFLQDS